MSSWLWFVGFVIVIFVFDKLMVAWINRHKDCPDVYSETGVENENSSNDDDTNS